MSDKPNDCAKCGESAFCVSWDGKHMVRPQRRTKCKGYHAPGSRKESVICRTEISTTDDAAIALWNETHGKLS